MDMPELVAPVKPVISAAELACLAELEKKVLWLATWMIHNANHLRESRDGLKVGGHQASSASLATVMSALYFHALRPQDRVAVKPHASPIFHAIQYLYGRQNLDALQRFRALGGAQSYPSRTKDHDDVDFSTGSVGLGAGITPFASLVQDYLESRGWLKSQPGRMVALIGDAELDEGNIYEALLEGWKHDLRNTWWIVDYNRQSLDGIVHDRLFYLIQRMFRANDWRVVTVKYGKRLMAAFEQPGGKALKRWINQCDNAVYSALTFGGGAAWRKQLREDLAGEAQTLALIDRYTDEELGQLMTNLGGHDLETLLEAFAAASADDVPTCFIVYTIKGHGLPFAGHKDNHAGLLTPAQVAELRSRHGVAEGEEWQKFAGCHRSADELEAFLARAPFNQRPAARQHAASMALPSPWPRLGIAHGSTQEAFGKLMNELARGDSDLAARIVTTSPDVTVSTNLGGWVNQRGLFRRARQRDVFRDRKLASAQKWEMHPSGQHIELGIAENNLFLNLAALGLSDRLFGERLIPVGTLYDPFVARGLDALNYACYQDARFVLVATPSGVTLAAEGGAHQSISSPLIGIGQPGLVYYEPAYADELAMILERGFGWMQQPEGESLYLRLSTRSIEQPGRDITPELAEAVWRGAYWVKAPTAGCRAAVVYCGVVAPEALAVASQHGDDVALLAVTSPGRLYAEWHHQAHACWLAQQLRQLPAGAPLLTVHDGHPAALNWLGAVDGRRTRSQGPTRFGQSSDAIDAYQLHGLDAAAIARALDSLLTQ